MQFISPGDSVDEIKLSERTSYVKEIQTATKDCSEKIVIDEEKEESEGLLEHSQVVLDWISNKILISLKKPHYVFSISYILIIQSLILTKNST